MKNRRSIILGLILLLVLTGAFALRQATTPRYEKYTDSFLDTFDTVTIMVAYTRTEAEFQAYFAQAHQRFQELHQLYNIYYDYPGINNVKTINDHAGIQPVKVDKEIIDLILFAKDWYKRTEGKTNIAMGAVLEIWHAYRETGRDDPALAMLPPMDELVEAASHSNIDDVIVDVENSTVYLPDSKMRLDVGAVAKGYATELVAKELAAGGLKSAMLSAGGNIRAIGKPLDGVRERWGVGIQDPSASIIADDGLLDVVFVNDASVVSSGDYQRYYVVDDHVLHHIIDPATLMPGKYYRAVTVVTKDSGVADLLSTELFLLPFEQSKALAESLEGVEALWVMEDGNVEVTEGMGKIMRSNGASGARRK